MILKALTLFVSLAPVALADFTVYCGQRCVNDGAGCPVTCIFKEDGKFNDCGEVTNSTPFVLDLDNDASGRCGGLACDGCDISQNARDWRISRLEINNSQQCTPSTKYWYSSTGSPDDDEHFTIYDNLSGTTEVRGTDGTFLGTCVGAEAPKDEKSCFGGISGDFYVHMWDCTSEIYYSDPE